MPLLSIVICTYNRKVKLHDCLTSVVQTANMATTEIIVVENGSTDGTVEMIRREFPQVNLIILPDSVGFCVANNVGVGAATAPYIMLLNDDAVLLGDAADGLVRLLQDHVHVKCVGPLIVLPNGKPQPRVFGNLPSLWRIAMQSLFVGPLLFSLRALEGIDGRHTGPGGAVGWVSGVCLVMRRIEFLASGGLDVTFFMYCEDIDLCWRLTQHGGTVVRNDHFSVLHFGGGQAPSVPIQVRNSLLQQSNLLKIVRKRFGPSHAKVAALLLFVGLLPRLLVGLVSIPSRGVDGNALLISSFRRMTHLLGHAFVRELPKTSD